MFHRLPVLRKIAGKSRIDDIQKRKRQERRDAYTHKGKGSQLGVANHSGAPQCLAKTQALDLLNDRISQFGQPRERNS